MFDESGRTDVRMYVLRTIALLAEDLPECRIDLDQPKFRVDRHAIAKAGVRADYLLSVRAWGGFLLAVSAGEFSDFQADRHEAALVPGENHVAVQSTL